MMKIIILFIVLSYSASSTIQKEDNTIQAVGGIKVIIKNFYKSPPNCGFIKNVSVYEAEVVDSLSAYVGTKLLVCVECKAERYPLIKGDHFIIKISEEQLYREGMLNFTNYSDEEIKKKRIFTLIHLAPVK